MSLIERKIKTVTHAKAKKWPKLNWLSLLVIFHTCGEKLTQTVLLARGAIYEMF